MASRPPTLSRGVAYTEAQLLAKISALEAAFDRHERVVQFADRSVTFASFDEILDRINYYKGLLSELRGRPRQFAIVGQKGLGC